MEKAAGGRETAHPLGGDAAGCGGEHELRGRAGVEGISERNTQPDRATRYVETTHGILFYLSQPISNKQSGLHYETNSRKNPEFPIH